jgi:hypothetical protein
MILSIATAMAQPASTQQRNKPSRSDEIDDRAMAILTRMSDYLRTLKAFRINSEFSQDEIVDTNMKIQKNGTNQSVIRMPDGLHAHLESDDHDLEFIYDGRTFTLFGVGQNFYASSPAPPTIPRLLNAVRAKYGIVFPLADFIQMAGDENLLQEVTKVAFLGTSRIDGVECDHLAVRQTEVDWQVWIQKGDKPLPLRLVITTKTQPTQPQFMTTLRWDLSPSIDDNMFSFTPPKDAVRIRFGRKHRDKEATP